MKEIEFEPFLFSRASEYIERRIAESILTRKLKAGDRLPTERRMARQFGVSLVTLREALRTLEISGLIEKRKGQGGGVFVSEMNSQSIKTTLGYFLIFHYLSPQHLYEVRKIIEPAIVRLASEKMRTEDILKLEKNVAFCEERLKKSRNHFTKKEFFDLDKVHLDFHRIIAEITRNPVLSLTIDYVFDFLTACEKNLLVADFRYSAAATEEHKRILHFIKKRDGAACEREMVHHLRALDKYLRDIQKKPLPAAISLPLGTNLGKRR